MLPQYACSGKVNWFTVLNNNLFCILLCLVLLQCLCKGLNFFLKIVAYVIDIASHFVCAGFCSLKFSRLETWDIGCIYYNSVLAVYSV